MKPESLDRDGCFLGGRRVTYPALARYYVCNECGGKPVHSFVPKDRVFCGECGGDDFIPELTYLRQIAEYREIAANLPSELRDLLPKSKTPNITVDEAITDLYD